MRPADFSRRSKKVVTRFGRPRSKGMNHNRSLLVLSFSLLAACAGTASPDAPEQNAQAVQALQAAQPAADINGTWVFDLDASEVASAVRQDCSTKPNPAQCWSEIAAEAKLEKIRFAPGTDGHSRWSSFAADPKGEILFLSVPVDLSSDGPNKVLAKVAGEAKGKQAPQFAKSNINQLRIEVVDAHTIALTDPKKGRLVYSKE
jgi:hypothetical protein